MTKAKAMSRLRGVSSAWSSARLVITTRTSWMANNAIPDSIIMAMICRSLGPSELNEPNIRSTEVKLTCKNTLRILNTIKPVTRAFTTMDAAKPVRVSVSPRREVKTFPFSIIIGRSASDASQVPIGYKLKSTYYQTKINWLAYVCDCQERRNDHDSNIFTPHDPTTVDLWIKIRWIKQMIGKMVCVPMCIGRWSHNNRLVCFGQ